MRVRCIVALAAALLFVSAAHARAQGYCFVSQNFCNNAYLEIGTGVGSQTLVGYEYGCYTNKDRLYSGTIRIVGTTAYVSVLGMYGVIGVTGGSPWGQFNTVTTAVNINTGVSTWVYWQFIYATSTGASGFGGGDTYHVSACSPPAGPEPDAVVKPNKLDAYQK